VEKGVEKFGCDLGFSPYDEVFEAIGAGAEYVEKPEQI
jgi:hypothetical protein